MCEHSDFLSVGENIYMSKTASNWSLSVKNRLGWQMYRMGITEPGLTAMDEEWTCNEKWVRELIGWVNNNNVQVS